MDFWVRLGPPFSALLRAALNAVVAAALVALLQVVNAVDPSTFGEFAAYASMIALVLRVVLEGAIDASRRNGGGSSPPGT